MGMLPSSWFMPPLYVFKHSRISPTFVIGPEKFLATHSNAKQCGMISVLGTQTALDPVILALFLMLALNAKKGRSL